MFLFPSDASSSQWPSGLVKDISPKIFSTAKHDHQHDEQSSPKHAMDQKLLSHAAVIDMYYLYLQINPFDLGIQRNQNSVALLVIFYCLVFVLDNSNKIFHLKYNKPTEQEVARDIE
ncbi:hypothetical protein PHYBLDRAFT_187006 [Phycomyces blakesleeanus NRRL 1555(-)]|uniref:Uncharacterized protein n=1 Tax=Phycomyces blakesleeanus (strain ATCC 8743b / DSM 1359 / FGSC 10004 / NBRC 33097 / NRRL 1555) TaxID=763407 RepID=A0A163AK98_PHYB8|nr:hypothetical protein PHYBLDRAFT_189298 [Phycomyces blakesleeanus NRRL 1555(-)]XP_018292101.1 hypothetical protein PHYBLDRAFT_73765 [Phycomyces blakesleeanus NRRL 1555(-)]XP_018292111.1 hypothetical protein PHYBLDRAFT_187006 [Phycomyces blakesleeanus NRRL 1555(-)]OAD66612.1 hypothetical protein PHYBLDRAFT_189298 [Phycomyces blakesleeanus NRRL 1555(-)]OAD74061.1 hypothetical protein PHYBLDRAFT_73765 [Phycomyces blakesleeanus NRRL 1555(-)]OAD74071.1 hypothetical protein PHYBLDRAFT_187006 [Phyc|eukprot:XP_018284652.1 hypothetical protein PHYBLDRAFT_189298 [Phycomyces blakesleeanus NRRL 1555(-)]